MNAVPARVFNTKYSVSYPHNKDRQKRTKKDYAQMIAVVRKEYPQLSVRDRYIFEILAEYDFPNHEGQCKGYIFPSVEKIASDYMMSASSIYRSIRVLKRHGLIALRRRQHSSPCIYILDIPEEKLSTVKNERQLSKTLHVYKGKEAIRNIANRFEYLRIVNEETIARLMAWGYDERQAVLDYLRFGVDELTEQLSNLSQLIGHGIAVQHPAKWLNWAIRARKRIDAAALETAAKRFARLTQASKLGRPTGHWVVDEDARTCLWVESNNDSESADIWSVFQEDSTTRQSDSLDTSFPPCDSMEKSGTKETETGSVSYSYLPINTLQNVQAFNPPARMPFRGITLPSVLSLRLSPSQHDHPRPASILTRVVVLIDRTESVCGAGGGCWWWWLGKWRERREEGREGKCKKFLDWEEVIEDLNGDLVEITINQKLTGNLRRIEELKKGVKSSVKNRTPRNDKGVPRYTERDMATLRWVAEQGTVRFDHLRLLLSTKAEREETRQLGKVSVSVARGVVDRWEKYGVAKCEKILGAEEPYVWLTPKGLRVLGFKEGEVVYRNWTPPAGKLAHYHWVNVVRLYEEERYGDKIQWVSERTIRNQRKQKTGHIIDARMIVLASQKRIALEVEISSKGDDEVLVVLRKTLNEEKPDAIWYFTTQSTYNVVSSARSRLHEDEQRKVSVELVTKLLEKEPLSRLSDSE